MQSCSALKKELAYTCSRIGVLEKSCSSSSKTTLHCEVCPSLVTYLHDAKLFLTNVGYENTYLCFVLNWESSLAKRNGKGKGAPASAVVAHMPEEAPSPHLDR